MADRAVLGSWRKASLCSTGACVEVLIEESFVKMRDSKLNGTLSQPALTFDLRLWSVLLDHVRSGPTGFEIEGVVVNRGTVGNTVVAGTEGELRFDDDEWQAFRAGVLAGEFNPAPLVGTAAFA